MNESTRKRPPVPPNFGIVVRPRLLEKLQKAWNHKLTLISAAPGYGKTTLIEQFAAQQENLLIRFTVEERDRDVATLYSRFERTLAEHFPGFHHTNAPYGYSASELGIAVTDHLQEHLLNTDSTELLLLLDDVHLLTGAPASETWLRTLVSHLPPVCHLVIASRVVPDLPLIDMIARREVLAIGQEELRFTPDEIKRFGQVLLPTPLSENAVEELATRLEGWPAGIALALQPLPTDFQMHVLEGSEGPEALFDVLARNMLDAQSPPLRQFLLVSSTLTRLTPELCTYALGCADTQDRLAEIQTHNLFINHVAHGLVYHTLFRTFLQRQLAVEQPVRFEVLHQQAAAWFEGHDDLDEAFNHYLLAQTVQKAATIAERAAYAYFAEGKLDTLLNWNNKLHELSVEVPKLLYLCAIICTDRYDYATAEANLEAAHTIFTRQDNQLGIADAQLQRATLKLQQGDYLEAQALVAPLTTLPEGPTNVRGRALNILGFSSLQTGNAEKAVKCLDEAVSLYHQYADAYSQSQVLQNLGTAYWRTGKLTRALECLQEVVAIRRSLGGANALAAALTILGYYYAQLGDYKQAEAALEEGLNVLARLPNKRYESYLLLNLGDVKRNQGAHTEALSLYRRALDILGDGEPSLRCTLLTNLSTLYRWQHDFPKAMSLADEAAALANKHHISMEGSVARIALLVASALQANPGQYLLELGQLIDDLHTRSENFALLHGLALYAHVAARAGVFPTVKSCLQRAVRTAESLGTYQPLVTEVRHSSELQDFLDENHLAYKPLLRELRHQQESSAPLDDQRLLPIRPNQTYQLRIFCLGQTRILRDGSPVDMVSLRRTGRDLVLYLLFEGAATREHLSALFWPDSSAQKTRQNFHTTLFRIRQELGENAIILQDQLYLLNPEVEIWCDALELEALVRKARLLQPRDARAEDMWQRAANLYQGDFLAEVDSEWAVLRRDTFHQLYVDALFGVGECARVRNDTSEALIALKRAVNLEPYREDIHQSIMVCYAAKGDKQKIVSHLTNLKKLLYRDLGISPSDETLAIAQNLLK